MDTKPTIVSALGAILKPNNKDVRLIHDCSRPIGLGLNSYATLPEKMRYQTVQEACELLDSHGYMAKVDLKSAYRSVALHPSQYEYTGLKWTFTGDNHPTYIIDKRLCFGARLSPGHFNRLTQAVCRMMKRCGYKTISYIDDFWITHQTKEGCQEALTTLMTLLRELGFSIAYDKVEGPTQQIIFLGILINSVSMSLHLPEDKVKAYKELLLSYSKRSRASYRQLQQLAGKLSWASHIVQGGRIYQQRVLDLMRPMQHPSHKVRLSSEFHADINWWLHILQVCNTKRLIHPKGQTLWISCDACQTGAGIVSQTDWAYIDWEKDLPFMLNKHINVKETMAIICAIYRWAPTWSGHTVVIKTDNITARAAFCKGRTKDKLMMAHIRHIFWLSVLFDFKIECVYTPGVTNIEADCVSRLRQKGHLKYWLSVLSGGLPYTIFDVGHWLMDHATFTTTVYVLSQVTQQVPWLKNWTQQLLHTKGWLLQPTQRSLTELI